MVQARKHQFKPNPRIPYSEVVLILKSLRWGTLKQIGAVSGYPFFVWKNHTSSSKPKVILSAGIHGNEPSGVECVLRLLQLRPAWLKPFNLTIFPCLNPWGYERNIRGNEMKHDVNRQWRHEKSQEVTLCKKVLGSNRYDLTCCLHEDYDGTGFYLYELCLNESLFGRSIINQVSRVLPIESRRIVEKRNCNRGVIQRPVSAVRTRHFWPEALYHIANHSDHTLTTETPTSFPIDSRIRGHIVAVKTALRLLNHSLHP